MKRLTMTVIAVSFLVALAVSSASALAHGDELIDGGNQVADITQNDDVLIEGRICASDASECADGEGFSVAGVGNVELKLKDNVPAIGFQDVAGGDEWTIAMVAGDLIASQNGISAPFVLTDGAPAGSLVVAADGAVGIGTTTPGAKLEVSSTAGTAAIVVDENSAMVERRVQLLLENQGQTAIGLTNADAAVEWEIGLTPKNHTEISLVDSPTRFTVKKSGGMSTVTSRGTNVFSLDANGSLRIRNSDDARSLKLTTNGNLSILGALTENSDRNSKHQIVPVNTAEVLESVRSLELAEWSYLFEDVRHVGPMAQDFYAAFELGANPTGLSTLDTAGVALAAVQELANSNDELLAKNAALEARIATIEAGGSGPARSTPWLALLGFSALLVAAGAGGSLVARKRGKVSP